MCKEERCSGEDLCKEESCVVKKICVVKRAEINELVKTVFAEQPLALPGSDNKMVV